MTKFYVVCLGTLEISVLDFGTQVRGFKPDRSRRIFQGEKIPQRAFLRKGSKPVGPMSLIYGMEMIPRRFVEVGVSAKLIGHFSPA
jgi:hypothetical protein